jgi:hypothetical protein
MDPFRLDGAKADGYIYIYQPHFFYALERVFGIAVNIGFVKFLIC